MGILKRLLGGLLLVLILGIGGLLIGARFSDGPLAIIAGGAFTTGQLVTDAVPDWSFVHDTRESRIPAPRTGSFPYDLDHRARWQGLYPEWIHDELVGQALEEVATRSGAGRAYPAPCRP